MRCAQWRMVSQKISFSRSTTMRHTKTRKYITITRILPVCLVISGAIFGSMAYNSRKGPLTAAAQTPGQEPIKRTTNRASDPIKVDGTIFDSVQDFAESLPDRCSTIAPPPDEREKLEAR